MENMLINPVYLINEFNKTIESSDELEGFTSVVMKQRIKSIIDSYHHTFDHFYEILQNAIDTCEELFSELKNGNENYSPKLFIRIDLKANIIEVIDNGKGMTLEVVKKYFFTPDATLKNDGDVIQRGEKGVGATFLSYSSNYSKLITISRDANTLVAGEVSNAFDWVKKKTDSQPKFSPINSTLIDTLPEEFVNDFKHGSLFAVQFSEGMNIEDLTVVGNSIDHWEKILRLFTALGYINLKEAQDKEAFFKALNVTLEIKDSNNRCRRQEIKLGYLYPDLLVNLGDQESQESEIQYKVKLSEVKKDLQELGAVRETNKYKEVLWERYTYNEVNTIINEALKKNEIRYIRKRTKKNIEDILKNNQPTIYVAFTYAKNFWEYYNQQIWGSENEEENYELEDEYLTPGILFATKSQKIGNIKDINFNFRSGDFNRFFILIDLKNLESDIGRKTLEKKYYHFANYFANLIHSEFTKPDCLKPADQSTHEYRIELQNLKDDIRITKKGRELIKKTKKKMEENGDSVLKIEKKINEIKSKYTRNLIGLNYLSILQEPEEEQDVIALFFELIGLKKIKGYEFYSTFSSKQYDAMFNFKINENDGKYNAKNNKFGIDNSHFTKGYAKSPDKSILEFKLIGINLIYDVDAQYKNFHEVEVLVCWDVGKKVDYNKEGYNLSNTIGSQYKTRKYYGVTHTIKKENHTVYVIELKTFLSEQYIDGV